jgi:cell wall-active antibiotic response 4TMS protein YvqF
MLQCMQCHGERHGVAPQLLLGLGAMFLGLLLVLDNFGWLQARRIVRLWPVLLIGMGLYRLYHSLRSRARPCGHVLVLLGTGLLLANFGLLSARQGLAVFLLIAGAVTALRATRRGTAALAPMTLPPDRDLDLFAFMSYISRALGTVLRGGQVTAIMGFCEIDLRGARIDGEAVVNVFAFWGGMDIRVPPGWLVEGRGVAVLGAFEDKSRRPDDDRQKLIVTGMVIMGGVEVKN